MGLTTCEIIWLRWLLTNISVYLKDPLSLHCDNENAIHIARNYDFHVRTKHIDTYCRFTHHHLQLGIIYLRFVPLALQIAYMFTKPHSILCFHFFI